MAYLNTYSPHGLTLRQTLSSYSSGTQIATIPAGINFVYAIVVGGGGFGTAGVAGGGGGVTAGWCYVKTSMRYWIGSSSITADYTQTSGFANLIAGPGGQGTSAPYYGGAGQGGNNTPTNAVSGSTSYWGNAGAVTNGITGVGGVAASGGGITSGFGQLGGTGLSGGGGGGNITATNSPYIKKGGDGWTAGGGPSGGQGTTSNGAGGNSFWGFTGGTGSANGGGGGGAGLLGNGGSTTTTAGGNGGAGGGGGGATIGAAANSAGGIGCILLYY
jgi:hypothetical protein